MTPRDVDAMAEDEYLAFLRFMRAELKAMDRAAKKANQRR